jgi:hypothetical protein
MVGACSRRLAAQVPRAPNTFRTEYGVQPFVGAHVGLPDGVSITLAGAVGLGHIAPGYLFAALEPGYAAGRRSVGWLLRDADNPLTPFAEHGFALTVRLTELTTYSSVAFYRSGRHYYGPELHVIFGTLGARLGLYAGAGPHASRLAFALGVGGGV